MYLAWYLEYSRHSVIWNNYFFPVVFCSAAFPTNKPDEDARHVIKVVSIALKFVFCIYLTFFCFIHFIFVKMFLIIVFIILLIIKPNVIFSHC